jgi:hypothetical protein
VAFGEIQGLTVAVYRFPEEEMAIKARKTRLAAETSVENVSKKK